MTEQALALIGLFTLEAGQVALLLAINYRLGHHEARITNLERKVKSYARNSV